MSISQKISDIDAAKRAIREKLAPLGVVAADDKLAAIATKISTMSVHSAIDAEVVEGNSFKIERGYHVGGTVRAISDASGDANKYKLQPAKTVDPSPDQAITVSPDTTSGYYGLSSVIVNPIPSKYKDISDTTADASTVLSGKLFVDKSGTKVAGTMPNIGAVTEGLDRSTTSYTIPAGYHNGKGTVSITLEEKSVTPTDAAQTYTPAASKVFSKITVEAIPAKYADTSKATVDPDELLYGTLAYGTENGKAIEVAGTMPNNGSITGTFSGLDSTTNSYTIPKGYTSGGTITLTSDIEDLLALI